MAIICLSVISFASDRIFRQSMTVARAEPESSTTLSDLQQNSVTAVKSEITASTKYEFDWNTISSHEEGLDNPVALQQDVIVCTPDEGNYKDILSLTITPGSGQTILLHAKTTTKRVPCPDSLPEGGGCENPSKTDSTLLAGMRIVCPGVNVQTTRNHRGTNSIDDDGLVQFASLLYHPNATEIGHPVTCRLQVLGGFGGRGCLKFLGNTPDATFLRASTHTGGVAWGTNLDQHNAEDNNCRAVTFIGRGLAGKTDAYPSGEAPDLGSREFVLKGRRFNAHNLASSLDVFSDVQLTCESDEGSCTVIGELVVQQMKSPTNKEICFTTQTTQTATINSDSHHQKLHLKALNVRFGSACIGRSFIIKTKVSLISEDTACIPGVLYKGHGDRCDAVVVEHGAHKDPVLSFSNGRSIAFVVQDFPIIKQQ